MLNPSNVRARLALSETYISEAERRIRRQSASLALCRRAGYDTRDEERLLRELEGTLAAWQEHRVEILRTIQ